MPWSRRSRLTRRISAGELNPDGCQPIGVPRRSPPLRGLLPFGFKIALRFQTDQQGVERAGFYIGEPRQFVTVRPSATRAEEDGENHPGMGRESA